ENDLWETDGTGAGTVAVSRAPADSVGGGINGLASADGSLFFTASDGLGRTALFQSDGTGQGTHQVAGTAGSYCRVDDLVTVNGTVLLPVYTLGAQYQVWRLGMTDLSSRPLLVTAPVAGGPGPSFITVRDPRTAAVLYQFLPYTAQFGADVHVAV